MTHASTQRLPASARSVICLRRAIVCGLAGLGLAVCVPATAKVEGDTIILGAAVSLTGKYSTNGKNTQDGYNLAVKRVNEMGGVKEARPAAASGSTST